MSGQFAFPLTVEALQARIADPLRLRADRPAPREDVERAARAGGRMTPAAVLVPLVLHPEPTVLLTLRSADLKAHAGQVSFPGGRLEDGEDAVTAALREAEEEIGLHTSLPEIVGELPPLLTGTGFLITPVVALLRPPFALQPDPGAALIHYSHTGARHSVLPAMLSKMGYAHAMQVEPVIKTDMLQKLQSKKFFKGLEFSLTDPKGVQEIRAMGGSVGRALGMLDDTGGVNIRVEITMGHTKGEGLVANATKALAKGLAKIGMDAGDDSSPVRAVKVRGSEGEDAPVEELDLLNAREVIEMQVDEADRSIDRSDCQKKLAKLLEDHKDTFKTQAGTP